MGIRVHKFLGYGLTDLEPGEKSRWCADPRINWESPLLDGSASPPGYYSWLEARREAAAEKFSFSLDWATLRHQGSDGNILRDCVAYDPEFGLPQVLAIRPFACTSWSRYDDPIDYMVESYPWTDRSQQNHVQVFAHGPFPFNGFYMDARDGRKLPAVVFAWWQLMNARGRAEDQEFKEGALDLFSREMGFSGQEEAKVNVVPEVPEEIRDLAEFGRLFTKPGIWLQLRPLLYTYWA